VAVLKGVSLTHVVHGSGNRYLSVPNAVTLVAAGVPDSSSYDNPTYNGQPLNGVSADVKEVLSG
jgi:hypothetical protein